MNGRIVRFVYISPHRKGFRPKPHQQRDESVALELMPTLCSLGFVYDGPQRLFLNHPPGKDADSSLEHLMKLGLTERDRLMLATRPPLDDHDDAAVKGYKPLVPSGSEVETIIFRVLREKCFDHCSREGIALSPGIARCLAKRFEDRSDIQFSLRTDRATMASGTYHALHGRPTADAVPWTEMMTAGYLINVPLGRGLPGLLAVFSTAGTTSLAWAYLLRERSDILKQAVTAGPSFTMAEIQTKPILGNPVDFRFCHDWEVNVILHCPIHDSRG